MLSAVCLDRDWCSAVSLQGPPGPAGPQGPPGADGGKASLHTNRTLIAPKWPNANYRFCQHFGSSHKVQFRVNNWIWKLLLRSESYLKSNRTASVWYFEHSLGFIFLFFPEWCFLPEMWHIIFYSFILQGIKGDRGPPGGPGDKGDKVYMSFMTHGALN